MHIDFKLNLFADQTKVKKSVNLKFTLNFL